LLRGFTRFARMSGAPRDAVPDPDAMAPFGVYDYEIGGSLDQAVASVHRYREVMLAPVAEPQAAPA
jgi:hypothetical protein